MYCPFLLSKVLLVGQLQKLSCREFELYVWEMLSARHFCGLATEDPVLGQCVVPEGDPQSGCKLLEGGRIYRLLPQLVYKRMSLGCCYEN